MSKFTDTVRIYHLVDDFEWQLLYETAANVQELNSGSLLGGVESSDYAAYCETNDIKFSTANSKLDWSGFNRDFSDNPNEWHNIKKPPFNYDRFGTVIYFDDVSN